ncbi:MAG: HEAT repeat domain-containing protein [Chloroflexi bacterium]|nr:HEAT repeat domain-containing protein [Chloroflexota bacterium]
MPILGPNIAQLQAKRDFAGLVHALKSKDIRTRCDALRALGELRDARAVPVLRDWLLADTAQATEQTEAAIALGKLGDTTMIDALFEASAISQTRERAEIAAAIASPDRTYRPGFYVNRIAADEYALRAAIAHALAQIGAARAVEKLFQMLATETGAMANPVKTAIKNAIATALKNQDAHIAPFLCEQLQHASVDVRECAAQCLSDFPDARTIDALLDAACNPNEHFTVREAALVTLGRIGDVRALPDLEALMRSDNLGLARDAKQCVSAIRQRWNLPTLTGF